MTRRRFLGLLLCGALVSATPTPVHAARQFNGTTQDLQSASAVDLSAYNKLALAFWLWWDTFANNDKLAFETGTDYTNPATGILVDPNHSSGKFAVGVFATNGSDRSFTRPSAGAWHHYVINLDLTVASHEVAAVYVDGVSQSLTDIDDGNNTGHVFANTALNFMCRNNASLFGAGRLAEVAIWGGINFSQTDVNNLYLGGAGTVATNVQNASLVRYWRIQGDVSPEPATTGSVNLTVNGGAPKVAHPFGDAAAPSTRAPKESGSRRRSTR